MIKIIIVTEGNKDVGFGHIARCNALYEGFEERKITPTLIINGDDSIHDLVKNKQYKIFNWLIDKKKLYDSIKHSHITVIDSYLAGQEIYKTIAKNSELVVYIDDNYRLDYPKGIVLNPLLNAYELGYPQNGDTLYLLGNKYTLLRKDFWTVSDKKINKNINNVLITFGGDDKRNMTPKILQFLSYHYPALIKKIIIGKGYQNTNEIEKVKDNNTELFYYPKTPKIRQLMIESDMAISASGLTLYELLRTGTPTIAVMVADNQINNMKTLTKNKLIEYAGDWKDRNLLSAINRKIEKLRNISYRKKFLEEK